MTSKSDLIQSLSEKLEGSSKKELKVFVDNFLEELSRALAQGNQVSLADFGNFLVRLTPPRTARNPQTGQPLQIPSKKKVSFRPSKRLKGRVNT